MLPKLRPKDVVNEMELEFSRRSHLWTSDVLTNQHIPHSRTIKHLFVLELLKCVEALRDVIKSWLRSTQAAELLVACRLRVISQLQVQVWRRVITSEVVDTLNKGDRSHFTHATFTGSYGLIMESSWYALPRLRC